MTYVNNPHSAIDPMGLAPYERFRHDSRTPEEIFEAGFEPKGRNMSLGEHVAGVSGDFTPASGFVSTTTSELHAFERLKTSTGHVYLIRAAEDGIDVNRSIPDNRMAHEREIAFPRSIGTSEIVGAWNNNREWLPNPNYGGTP